MPVVVVNSGGALGHAVVSALLRLGAEIEVRATVSDPSQRRWFLDRGVPVAVTELDDADLLEVIFTGSHTVVLLDAEPSTGGPDSERAARDAALRVVVAAMEDAGVRRLIAAGTWGADVVAESPQPPAAFEGSVEVLTVNSRIDSGESAGIDVVAAEIVALDSRGSAR